VTVYADASALVKLVVDEAESPDARGYLAAGPRVAASRLVLVEVPRALRRRYDADPGWADRIFEEVDLIDVDVAVLTRAARLEPPALRTLDAIHLATAMAMGAELEALVTYDTRLAAAARALGIAVVSPGVPMVPRDARALHDVHEAG
jgi:predicted nucleic acid-binding protein